MFFLLKIKQVYETEPEKQYQIAPEFFMQRVNTLDWKRLYTDYIKKQSKKRRKKEKEVKDYILRYWCVNCYLFDV